MINKLISIIIPVFNVEKYLRKCVDSVIAQTYKNLEIILVDDGSTDNCPIICDDYATKDKRVKVVHKSNGGLSDARNVGLEIACGDFIGFVDSDDYIEPTMYEELLLKSLSENADITMCEARLVYEDGKEVYNTEVNLWNVNGNNFHSYAILLNNQGKNSAGKTDNVMCCVWRCLYKKSFIENKRFVKGMWYEDFIFMNEIVTNETKFAVVKKPLYNYFQRESGIVRTFNKEKYIKRVEFSKAALELLKDKISIDQHKYFSFYLYEQIVSECACAKEYKELFKLIKKNKFLKQLCKFKNYILKVKATKSLKKKLASTLVYLKLFKLYRFIYLKFKSNK